MYQVCLFFNFIYSSLLDIEQSSFVGKYRLEPFIEVIPFLKFSEQMSFYRYSILPFVDQLSFAWKQDYNSEKFVWNIIKQSSFEQG